MELQRKRFLTACHPHLVGDLVEVFGVCQSPEQKHDSFHRIAGVFLVALDGIMTDICFQGRAQVAEGGQGATAFQAIMLLSLYDVHVTNSPYCVRYMKYYLSTMYRPRYIVLLIQA